MAEKQRKRITKVNSKYLGFVLKSQDVDKFFELEGCGPVLHTEGVTQCLDCSATNL